MNSEKIKTPSNSLIVLIFLSVYLCSGQNNTTQLIYCSSFCASPIEACWGSASNECYACSATLFHLHSDNGTCVEKSQNELLFYQLKTDNMELDGYSTDEPTPILCGQYWFSGQYIADSYISKTFNGLGTNHYQVVLRFGMGYIGSWNDQDEMQVIADDEINTWSYNCSYPSDICSGSEIDCLKIVQIIIDHNASDLSLEITSMITQTDPTVKYWGIKDLLIGVKTCHSHCLTCTGPSSAQCLSCQNGYYLLGNTCVTECLQQFAIPNLRKCAPICPFRYFPSGSNICQPCESGCFLCDETTCMLWENKDRQEQQQEEEESVWSRHLPFWILLILIAALLIFFLFWKFFLKNLIDRLKSEDNLQVNPQPNEGFDRKNITNQTLKDEEEAQNHIPKTHKNSTQRIVFMNSEHINNSENEIERVSGVWTEQDLVQNILLANPKKKNRRRRNMNQQMNLQNGQEMEQGQNQAEEQSSGECKELQFIEPKEENI